MAKEDVCSDTSLLVPEFQNIVSGIMNLVVIKNWMPFAIFETMRSQERQQWLFDNGYSKTLKSNHATGRAIDLVVCINGKWSWEHIDLYKTMNQLVKEKFGDKVNVGGLDFGTFKDYPHIEMK